MEKNCLKKHFFLKQPLVIIIKQSGAELCQAQVKLEGIVDVWVGVEVEACHPRVGGWVILQN